MNRETCVNSNSYKEVTLAYRIHRAKKLDANDAGNQNGRLVCPMVEAGRSTRAYGQKFIPNLESKDLASLAKALGTWPIAMKGIAYCSGNLSSVMGNVFSGTFKEEEIKNGLVHTLKNGVHTGIFRDGKFVQEEFNKFVWSFCPELEHVNLDNDWLYCSNADYLYLGTHHLDQVRRYCQSNSDSKRIWLGTKLSDVEMRMLLVGFLGQELTSFADSDRGILVRDIYDLYKYGFVPAVVEESLADQGLLDI